MEDVSNEIALLVNDIMRCRSKEDRFSDALELLNIKSDEFNVIHVGGTNGKSSVSYKTSQALVSAGFKTILFTSPHILDCTERIRFQGQCISHSEFVNLSNHIRSVIGNLSIHFFSYFLLMALLYYKRVGADWIVLETGIGGLLDKTNFVTNTKVVVITSIGYDHLDLLGNTLDEIAYHKAGSIKRNCSLVLGPNCYKNEIFTNEARKLNTNVFECRKLSFSSFDEENTEITRIIIEDVLNLNVDRNILKSRLKMRMQQLSVAELENTKLYLSKLYKPFKGLPNAVILDIAHNETAIDRLCRDIISQYKGKIRICAAISHTRTLKIFNPAAKLKNDNGAVLEDLYYLPTKHTYCRNINDENIKEGVSTELDRILTKSQEKVRDIKGTSGVEGNGTSSDEV